MAAAALAIVEGTRQRPKTLERQNVEWQEVKQKWMACKLPRSVRLQRQRPLHSILVTNSAATASGSGNLGNVEGIHYAATRTGAPAFWSICTCGVAITLF